MELVPNSLVFGQALAFKNLAEAGLKSDPHSGVIGAPYVCNTAFSIELLIKSLVAKSSREIEMWVGDKPLYKDIALPADRGHDPSKLLQSLPDNIREELIKRCDPGCRKNLGGTLEKCLEQHRETFYVGRYIFEQPTHPVRFNLGLSGIEEIGKLWTVIHSALTHGKINLVGTTHTHQEIRDSKNRIPGDPRAFNIYLTRLVESLEPDLIAEEYSAGYPPGVVCTVPKQLADDQQIAHLYCEMDEQTRIEHGIEDRTTHRMNQLMKGIVLSAQELDAYELSNFPVREKYWLDKLSEIKFKSCLMVVGSKHIDSFSAGARACGYRICVAKSNWAPKS